MHRTSLDILDGTTQIPMFGDLASGVHLEKPTIQVDIPDIYMWQIKDGVDLLDENHGDRFRCITSVVEETINLFLCQ